VSIFAELNPEQRGTIIESVVVDAIFEFVEAAEDNKHDTTTNKIESTTNMTQQ
jgi:hypothetical protein